jgi:hypothetical protein
MDTYIFILLLLVFIFLFPNTNPVTVILFAALGWFVGGILARGKRRK